jgi:hypothetical protein
MTTFTAGNTPAGNARNAGEGGPLASGAYAYDKRVAPRRMIPDLSQTCPLLPLLLAPEPVLRA